MSSGYPLGSASDPAAPWNRADIDPRILTRADDLCAAGFDERDAWTEEWRGDNSDLMFDVAGAAIDYDRTGDDTSLRAAVARLRDRYVTDSREMYLAAATEELTEEEA